MSPSKLILALVLPLLAMAGQAQAQKLRPGLWEVTMTMKSQSGEMEAAMAGMQAELAKMSPEQRKQIESMMGQRGVGMGAGASGGGTTLRTCISKETAERGDVPDQEDRSCKREQIQRSGSTLKFKLRCSNPPSTGEGEFTFSSDKAYSGRMVFDTQRKGKAEHMEMTQQAKWIAADCGQIKPR